MRSDRGRDVLLFVANQHAGPMAINFMVNLHALSIHNGMLLASDAMVCGLLTKASTSLPAAVAESVMSTPCVRDEWWEDHTARQKTNAIASRLGVWLSRWSVVARLVRLGYNVLSCDVDVGLLADPYPHLHSASLCGRFAIGFASDYNWKTPELQSGFAYICGARRDGAAAWVIAEAVDRYLRLADACGGAYAVDEEGGTRGDSAGGTACPTGSWLHAARQYDGFAFDQWLLRGTLHSAIARDGAMWWSVLEDTSSSSWPWRSNRSVALTIAEVQKRDVPNGVLRITNGPSPSASSTASASVSMTGATQLGWTWSDIVAASEEMPPRDWPRRFALGRRGHRGRRAFWATLRAGVPLARQLPRAVGEPLDLAWQQACAGSLVDKPDTSAQKRALLAAGCNHPSQRRGPPLSPEDTGLLPHRRGELSRRWQRLLDADLAAGRRCASGVACRSAAVGGEPFRDGDGGATWAGPEHGDERAVLLPQWIVAHWTVAQTGLVGGPLPHTLLFHATNAADKELVLKANGLWYFGMANLARVSGGLERDIFAGTRRPRVVAHEPEATRALTTRTFAEHMAEVITPLLLAAHVTNRTPALPRLPCRGLSWRVPPWTPRSERNPPLAGSHAFPGCRTGACSFHVIATGAASAGERAAGLATAAALNITTPFSAVLGADAARIGASDLSCVPMEGAQHGFRGDGFTSGHRQASVLHAPMWEAYLALLRAEHNDAPIATARVHIKGAAAASRKPKRTPTVRMQWNEFVDALRAAEARAAPTPMVLHLPSRLRVLGVPQAVQSACDGCVTHLANDAFGGLDAYASAGFCAETGPTDEGADCATADKGIVSMGARGRVAGPVACLRYLSASCPRARFASVSVSEKDCSWYHACDIAHLRQSGLGHQSFDMTKAVLRLAIASEAGGDSGSSDTFYTTKRRPYG